jgi:hypothetical protein|tara:strand:- start:663 stop:1817 length:1155 start_codon:yes stop_codon:yes gene_type:complete
MKKIKKALRLNTLVSILLILSITVFYTGCSKAEGIDEVVDEVIDSENSSEQDKLVVENKMESFMSCMENLESGQFSQLLLDIYDNVENDNTSYHDDLSEAFSDLNIAQVFEGLNYPYDLFDFSNHSGTYIYNDALGKWITESANNVVEILFPILTNSASNDLEIRLSDVTQEFIEVIDEGIYIPTSLVLDVFYNSERVFGINIKNVKYEIQDEIPIPTDIDIVIYTNPFTHEIKIDRINSKYFSVHYSLDNGSGCTTEIKSDLELLSSDYENLEDKDIKSISGYILINDLKFEYDGNMEYLLGLDDPTTSQINNYVDLSVLENNTKIGELKLIEETDGDYSVVMVFMDGTEVDLKDFDGIGFEGEYLIDRIEGIISRYTNRLDE